MKKTYILSSLVLASIGFFAFQESNTSIVQDFSKEHRFSGGGIAGKTGAPGESNCTDCHSGSTLSGATENSFFLYDNGLNVVTSYVPGDTYTATLQMASAPAKAGFSSTTLDASDVKAGTLIGASIGGTQNFADSGRDYVSQTGSSNTSADWAWSWVAPTTSAGDVTFYIATNATNDDGTTSGDMIYLSEHVITVSSTQGINETSNEANFTAGYNATSNKLMLDFTTLAIGDMNLNLVDMNGRSVFTYNLGTSESGSNNETIALPSSLNDGMYVVHFFVGNKAMSANILVKK